MPSSDSPGSPAQQPGRKKPGWVAIKKPSPRVRLEIIKAANPVQNPERCGNCWKAIKKRGKLDPFRRCMKSRGKHRDRPPPQDVHTDHPTATECVAARAQSQKMCVAPKDSDGQLPALEKKMEQLRAIVIEEKAYEETDDEWRYDPKDQVGLRRRTIPRTFQANVTQHIAA